MEEKEEQLFICDHEQECDNPHCCGHEPHFKDKHCMDNSFCDYVDADVSCIPYKEKEKEEPKTKRVAVIWFGEIDHNINPDTLFLVGKRIESRHGIDAEKISDVKPIDPDRLRYGRVKEGDTFLAAERGGVFECKGTNDNAGPRLIIDPPTKPETVEQVLDDLFGMEDRHSLSKGIIDSFKSRIKAAQNNQPQPPEAC